MYNKETEAKVHSSKSYFTVLYNHLLFIILVVIIGGLVGCCAGIIRVKPVYTKSMSLMLIAEVDATEENSSNTQDMALSQYWLGDVNKILKSRDFVAVVNQDYTSNNGAGSITAGAIGISYSNEESLIFSLSYTDSSYELAESKLNAVISKAKVYLQDKIVADNVELKETSNFFGQGMTYNYTSYIIIGLFAGLVLSVGFVTIRHLLDNTVKDRFEAEELTGANLLACIQSISDEEIAKSKKRNKQRK